MSAVAPAQKTLSVADFPPALVDAIGGETIENMPYYSVTSEDAYLSNCFDLSMFSESNAIKGTDDAKRPFIALRLTNKETRDTKFLAIFKRSAGEKYKQFCHSGFSYFEKLSGSLDMTDAKYGHIKQIFQKTHPDFVLGASD